MPIIDQTHETFSPMDIANFINQVNVLIQNLSSSANSGARLDPCEIHRQFALPLKTIESLERSEDFFRIQSVVNRMSSLGELESCMPTDRAQFVGLEVAAAILDPRASMKWHLNLLKLDSSSHSDLGRLALRSRCLESLLLRTLIKTPVLYQTFGRVWDRLFELALVSGPPIDNPLFGSLVGSVWHSDGACFAFVTNPSRGLLPLRTPQREEGVLRLFECSKEGRVQEFVYKINCERIFLFFRGGHPYVAAIGRVSERWNNRLVGGRELVILGRGEVLVTKSFSPEFGFVYSFGVLYLDHSCWLCFVNHAFQLMFVDLIDGHIIDAAAFLRIVADDANEAPLP